MSTPPDQGSASDTALFLVLAAALGLCGLVWTVSQAAALLFSGRLIRLSLAETVTAAAQLKDHLGDPSQAWPPGVRAQLPGPVGFYGVTVVVLAVVLVLALQLVNLIAKRGRKPPAPAAWSRPSAAAWSNRRDVQELRLDGGVRQRALWRLVRRQLKVGTGLLTYYALYRPTRTFRRGGHRHTAITESTLVRGLRLRRKRLAGWWQAWRPVVVAAAMARAMRSGLRQEVSSAQHQSTRLVLGALPRGGHLLAAEARHSVVVFGPTQMLKTAAVVIPALLEWQGPALATSIKPDVVQTTCRHRQTRGDVWVYDPTSGLGRPGDTWSPLAACGEWEAARKMGQWLTAAGASSQHRDAVSEFFEVLGSKFVGPLLFAAAHDDRPMRQVLSWINRGEEEEPARILEAIGDAAACESFEAHCRREERFKGNVVGTAEVILDVYNDPAVARSAESSRIDPARLLEGDNTLYLYAPEHEQDRLRPLFEALMQSVMRVAIEKAAAEPSGQLELPFLVLLDEAAHIARMRNLAKLANTVAAANIQLVSIWHDMAQLRDLYGPLADSVVNGHRAKLLLPGISDPATLEYLSRLIGQAEYLRRSVSRGRSWGNVTTTDASEFRDLAPVELLRQLPRGAAVLLYGNKAPVYLYLRAWFGDRTLYGRGAASLEQW
jgi:type IV secretion system protein VirD4